MKLTGKFVYLYKNVLLILYITVTTLICSQYYFRVSFWKDGTSLSFKEFRLCLGTNFDTNYCCFLVCTWDMQLKRVCVENCRNLLHCWQVNVVLFIHSIIHSLIHLFIYLFTQVLTWWLCFFSDLITRTGNTRYDHSFLPFELTVYIKI